MTADIERVLKEKCSQDPRLELLHSQWAYDKRLVGQALQTVGNTFPHYSLHDASHSSTILVQITRVLGARLDKLSATDLWLLLESAYWHDMGMVVDDNTLRKWWSDKAFAAHLDSLLDSTDDMLANAARLLKSAELRCKSSPLDIKHAVTLVVADFARRSHADRSDHLVNHPLSIGLQSPRVLIPTRLFRWVGQIALSHGRSEDFVKELPQFESGMATDICHPRLIACLLRLGDLLDLDNGRFCPVLASTVGTLPPSSLAHVGKHAAIRRFCVTPEKIEVLAVCEVDDSASDSDPYAAYEATVSWLGWLNTELQFLASHWTDIAPANFGGAPSIGQIEAQLNDYIYLEEGVRPRFRVDESTFLQLIRSNNLYEGRNAWLRELIANAEDATRIRAFVEHKNEASKLEDVSVENPLDKLKALLKPYPIAITLKQDKEAGNQLQVSIRDKGTGISLNDLKFILTIGSSRKNRERRQIIDEMPPILKPTGAFGLGLQSIFMVTNEVRIESVHFQTRDRLSITIRRKSPGGPLTAHASNGSASPQANKRVEAPTGVYVKKLPHKHESSEPGTHIWFNLMPDHLRQLQYQVDRHDDSSPSDDTPTRKRPASSPSVEARDSEEPEARVDPILMELGGLNAEYLRGLLKQMATYLAAPIQVGPDVLNNAIISDEQPFYSHREGCSVLFRPCTLLDNPVVLRHRGREIKTHDLDALGLIKVEFDLHSGDASEILTANRDALTPYGNVYVQDKLHNAIADVFPRYLEKLKAEAAYSKGRKTRKYKGKRVEAVQNRAEDSLSWASLYARIYRDRLPKLELEDSWQNVSLYTPGLTVSKLMDESEFKLEVSNTDLDLRPPRKRRKTFYLRKDHPYWVRDALLEFKKSSQLVSGDLQTLTYEFYQDGDGARDGDSPVGIIWGILSWTVFTTGYFRPTFPAIKNFDHLVLNVRQLPKWALRDKLLLRRQIVSPIEFLRSHRGLVLNTSHLRFYLDWILEKRGYTGDDPEGFRMSVKKSVREFSTLVLHACSVPNAILEQDDGTQVRLNVDSIDAALSILD